MSRKSAFLIIAVFSALVVTSVATVVAVRFPSQDIARTGGGADWKDEWLARLGEVVLPLLDPGDTEYAPEFDEEAFARIEIGATEREVLEKLGQPLDRKSFLEPIMKKTFPAGGKAWYYSRHGPRSKSYFVRVLVFDGEGRVARKFRSYYVD